MASVEVGVNATNTDDDEDDWASVPSNRLVTLGAIMLVALIGNCIIVIALTCTRYRVLVGGQTSGRVSIFILNLAISDLAVCLITIPGEMIVTVFGEWVLGATACKLVVFAQIVALAGTIFNLSAMSYDRYLAICQPLRFRNSVSRAQRTIAVAWLLAFILSVPQLFIFVQVERGTHSDGTPIYDCASKGYTAWWQRRVYFSCLTVCILVVPAALITFCYVSIVGVVWRQGNMQTVVEMRRSTSSTTSVLSLRKSVNDDKFLSRAKVRTIKLTLCIILTFVACWTPYFVVNNIRIHSHYETEIPASVRSFAETFALINSALNPMVYMCFNLNVKKAFQDICWWRCCCCDDMQDGHRRHRTDLQTGVRAMLRNAVVNFNEQSNAPSEFNSSCVDDTTVMHASMVDGGSPSAGSVKARRGSVIRDDHSTSASGAVIIHCKPLIIAVARSNATTGSHHRINSNKAVIHESLVELKRTGIQQSNQHCNARAPDNKGESLVNKSGV